MSEDDITVRVHFRRAVTLSNGSGTVEAGLELDSNLPITSDVNQVIDTAREQFAEVKALVYTELGLAFNQSEGGVIAEVFTGALPVAAAPAPPQLSHTQVVDDSSGHIGEQQQTIANQLGNHLVRPSGEPDLIDGKAGMPLPNPDSLTDWTDKMWYMLLTAPHEWDDVREDASQEADFIAKESATYPNKGVLGAALGQHLYLQSKFGPAPAWVIDNLWMVK